MRAGIDPCREFPAIIAHPTPQEAVGTTIATGARGWYPQSIVGYDRHEEETRLWKWRAYGNHKTISTAAWKSRREREIPTFPQAASSCCVLKQSTTEHLTDRTLPVHRTGSSSLPEWPLPWAGHRMLGWGQA